MHHKLQSGLSPISIKISTVIPSQESDAAVFSMLMICDWAKICVLSIFAELTLLYVDILYCELFNERIFIT